ncbi:MAG TPA: multicopper oxidase domain-containing protein [Actinomycetota bacterium]|nr:multicopper oxidase domain-containing protein [Actinomycetota bacterium]
MAIKAPPGKAGRTTVPDGGPATRGPAARPPARGNEALGREIGTAFYRIFPALIIIVGLALVVMVALWAVNPGTTASPSTGNGATLPTGNGMVEANGTVVNVNLTAVETDQTIVPAAAGVPAVVYHVWTFDGTAPGPVIRVHLGDTVQFTIHNATTMGMQHSIDFHAAMTPWANLPAAVGAPLSGNYQPVNPGETKTFDWVASLPGVFMYHCGAAPVLEHIANGMYGAIIVEPKNLPEEREYVLVNSELYPMAKPIKGISYGDPDAMAAATPKYVVWNGVADQYKASPLVAKPNEKFRIWIVDAGPTLTSAWHVIGAMFDSYADGNPANPVYGDQTYNIPPGGGAMFELQIPEAGLYPFVTHAFAYTGRGAVGLIQVDPNAPSPPSSYPTLGDPFSAGVKPFAPPTAVAGVVGISPESTPSTPPTAAPTATGPAPASGDCSPKGTSLSVTAQTTAFDASCLAAPANTPFTIQLMNMDAGVPHNVSIFTDSSATQALFIGEVVNGPTTVTYEVPALKPGTYFFRCDVHPTQMTGNFVVK